MTSNLYKNISSCRICGNSNLVSIFDLGTQFLTGVFPKNVEFNKKGPVELIKCYGENSCGLVQLKQSYNLKDMYGLNYGYRSGLNSSMVLHLKDKVSKINKLVNLKKDDLVIDIGSNDGTTLGFYDAAKNLKLLGIDPTGNKFKNFYRSDINLISDFFSKEVVLNYTKCKAKVITSFSMFYDLEDPISFMRDIYEVLDDNGVWIFEQSYLPTMLSTNSFDTICHEHLEFYSLKQIQYMTDKVGFEIIDIEFNDVNGGSISVVVKKGMSTLEQKNIVNDHINNEKNFCLEDLKTYQDFIANVKNLKFELIDLLKSLKNNGKNVYALGASTKGNVLLQYFNITKELIEFIGEVNSEKFNCYTPGSFIPIISEKELLEKNPDYLLVLPWHFKNFFLNLNSLKNINLIFPLPNLHIVNR